MEVPWEVLIKIYRDKLGSTKFSHLGEYLYRFQSNFLDNSNPLIPIKCPRGFMKRTILSYYEYLKEEIKKALGARMGGRKRVRGKRYSRNYILCDKKSL